MEDTATYNGGTITELFLSLEKQVSLSLVNVSDAI